MAQAAGKGPYGKMVGNALTKAKAAGVGTTAPPAAGAVATTPTTITPTPKKKPTAQTVLSGGSLG